MIYYENASHGKEGLNTHVMSWTMCISLSNFLDRDFYFDFEIPCSTPPAYAFKTEFRDRFRLLVESPRSLVSQLVEIPNRRVFEIDRSTQDKAAFQLIYSYFGTTEEMKDRFAGTMIWDSFSVGRQELIRENLEHYGLIEWTHTKLSSPAIFYFLPRKDKQELLDSVKIKYLYSIERLAGRIDSEIGPHHAIHLRLGDYIENYASDGYTINARRFRDYLRRAIGETERPVLVATDGLDQKELIAPLVEDYQALYIDELVFDEYSAQYSELEFTDFNVLSIINQLLCASAKSFIGTYRSTFTAIIHRLRQERYGKSEIELFPDDKVSRLLNSDLRITPDRQGFFDWNRYSIFAESHGPMSWMREWNHDLSTIDL